MPRQLSSRLAFAGVLGSLCLLPRPAAARFIHTTTSTGTGHTPVVVTVIVLVLLIIVVAILIYRYNNRRVRGALDAEGGPGMLPPGQQPAWMAEGGGGAASVNPNAPQNYSQAPDWVPVARTHDTTTAGAQFPVPMYGSPSPAMVQAPQPVYNGRGG
ncbi:hypothetical protein C8F01DRAFT_1266690 [Mycena amicta]|nr:hypothetical protein C8F01DRAFT_1266690 [Mycena amicta]